MRRSSKLPSGPNQRAVAIVDLSTQEFAPSIKDYLASIGRKGGLIGGKARAKKLSKTRRIEIAKKAAHSRWARQRENDRA